MDRTGVGFMLLYWSLATFFIISVAGGLDWIQKRKVGTYKASVWTAALILCWIVPVSPFVFAPFYQLHSDPAPISLSPQMAGMPDSGHRQSPDISPAGQTNDVPDQERDAAFRSQDVLQFSASEEISGAAGHLDENLSTVLILLWSAGVLYLLLRILRQEIGFSRELRQAQEIEDEEILSLVNRIRRTVFISRIQVKRIDLPISPFVKGIRTPTLYLPDSILRKNNLNLIQSILFHEFSHLRRYDLYTHFLMNSLRVVLWFCPHIWFLRKQLHDTQDKACDEYAAALMGDQDQYADDLLTLAREMSTPRQPVPQMASVQSFFGSSLKERVNSLFHFSVEHFCRVELVDKGILFFLSILLLSITGISGHFVPPYQPVIHQYYAKKIINDLIIRRETLIQDYLPENSEVIPSVKENHFLRDSSVFAHSMQKALSVAAADLNQDSYPDVIVGTDVGASNLVLINDGGKGFREIISFGSRREKVLKILPLDIDRDGVPEFTILNPHGENQIYQYRDGTVESVASYGAEMEWEDDVFTLDINRDSYPDILSIDHYFNITAYINDQLGGLQAAESVPEERLPDLLPVAMDITVQPATYQKLYAFTGFSKREVSEPNYGKYNFMLHGKDRILLIMDDIDNDQDYDLLIKYGHIIFVFKNFGGNSLVFDYSIEVRNFAEQWVSGDIDLDNDVDLILVDHMLRCTILLNDGFGFYHEQTFFSEGGDIYMDLCLADMDQDGDPDILLAGTMQGLAYVENRIPYQVQSVEYDFSSSDDPGFVQLSMTQNTAEGEFVVTGNQSGTKKGQFSADGRTYTFIPESPFFPGEKVSVSTGRELRSRQGEQIHRPAVFNFQVPVARSNGNFSLQQSFGELMKEVSCVETGDLNGDGYLDIITASSTHELYIYFNQGDGTFHKSDQFGTVDDRIWEIKLLDFDLDGDLDLITAQGDEVGNRVYENTGKGRFRLFRSFPQWLGSSTRADTGDLNGDGWQDIAFFHGWYYSSGGEEIHAEKGTHINIYSTMNGSFFEHKQLFALKGLLKFVFADWDRDFDLDTVFIQYSNSLYVSINEGNGNPNSRAAQISAERNGVDIKDLAVVDLDNDQDLDIVYIADEDISLKSNENIYLLVCLRNKYGKFEKEVIHGYNCDNYSYDTFRFTVADMNGDGLMDIFASHSRLEAEVVLLMQNPDQTFSRVSLYHDSNPVIPKVATGDMDNDGDLDIVLVSPKRQAMIFHNQ
ncbi:MAG: FG-GAP-like repeat-containing protein [bacterium]